MARKQSSKDSPYNGERDTEPSRQTGNITSQNNNVEMPTPGAVEPDVEQASAEGIGDAALNDRKLTDYTSNHAGDA